MKYTVSMYLSKNNEMIFSIALGEFATCDEAKAVIEKHKETIEICDFHMKAEYTVLNFKDDNDDKPEKVYSLEVSNEEEDKITALCCYVENLEDIETVADIFCIEPDCALEEILNELQEEYQLLNTKSPVLGQSPKHEEYQTIDQLFEKYRDKINALAY